MAWEWLVAHGQTPTETAVAGRVRMVQEAKAGMVRRRDKELAARAAAAEAIAADGWRAREWVAGYRAAHGQGPLWRELAEAMGWSATGWSATGWQHRKRIITGLRRAGMLSFDDGTERSLDIGPGLEHLENRDRGNLEDAAVVADRNP